MLLHSLGGRVFTFGTSVLENGVLKYGKGTGSISIWRKQHPNSWQFFLEWGLYCQVLGTCHISYPDLRNETHSQYNELSSVKFYLPV
jgi:hypothetical protein